MGLALVTPFPSKPRLPENPPPGLGFAGWVGVIGARGIGGNGRKRWETAQALRTVTDKRLWGWRPPTFLSLLELSGPCREGQFGPDHKFSFIRGDAVFVFLCLWEERIPQSQNLLGFSHCLSSVHERPLPTSPCQASAGLGEPQVVWAHLWQG